MRTLPALALLLWASLSGCGAEQATSSRPLVPDVESRALVPLAGAYVAQILPRDGLFEDVNEGNLIVGMIDGYAVAWPWGQGLSQMSTGAGAGAWAHAVNEAGVVAGGVTPRIGDWPSLSPAVWMDYSQAPIVLPELGVANDVNDAVAATGTLQGKIGSMGFVWDVKNGVVDTLPPLPGGRQTLARAINEDWVVLGSSESSAGWVTVLWERRTGSWRAKEVRGGIDGWDIDAGYGVVGATRGAASYGYPDHAGYLRVTGTSQANAISRNGIVAGRDTPRVRGVTPRLWPFVAERSGALTYLPVPMSPFTKQRGEATAVNSRGLAIGLIWPWPSVYTSQPVVWDPGC